MAHAHAHSHSHYDAHDDGTARFGRAFALATVLNLALVAVQVGYGVAAHSVALLADAGHNFGDAVGLLMAWGAHALGQVRATERFTYGFRSASIMSALTNAVLLLVGTGAIAWEAIRRLGSPEPSSGMTMMLVAAAGIAINGLSAWLLVAGSKGDLNIRSAFLHLLADAIVSAGVVVAGAVILWTGSTWVDPVASLGISAVIIWGTWTLLKESFRLSMAGVPAGIAIAEVRRHLEAIPGVTKVHHLHVWAMSTTENALTAHLVFPKGHPGDAFLVEVGHDLGHRFGIQHPTLQIEIGDGEDCAPDCAPAERHLH